MRNFIQSTIAGLASEVDAGEVRVGLATFDSHAKTQIRCGQISSASELASAVESVQELQFSPGLSLTEGGASDAFKVVRTELSLSISDGLGPAYVIMLTDGKSESVSSSGGAGSVLNQIQAEFDADPLFWAASSRWAFSAQPTESILVTSPEFKVLDLIAKGTVAHKGVALPPFNSANHRGSFTDSGSPFAPLITAIASTLDALCTTTSPTTPTKNITVAKPITTTVSSMVAPATTAALKGCPPSIPFYAVCRDFGPGKSVPFLGIHLSTQGSSSSSSPPSGALCNRHLIHRTGS
eukprot:gene8679-11395_t